MRVKWIWLSFCLLAFSPNPVFGDTNPIQFYSIKWGASTSEVKSKLEKENTLISEEAFGNGKLVIYSGEFLGHQTKIRAFIHPQHGLVQGSYRMQMHLQNDCLEEYKRIRKSIDEHYPELKSVSKRTGATSLYNSCQAAILGEGTLATIWIQNANVSSVREAYQALESKNEERSINFAALRNKFHIVCATSKARNWIPKVEEEGMLGKHKTNFKS